MTDAERVSILRKAIRCVLELDDRVNTIGELRMKLIKSVLREADIRCGGEAEVDANET